MSKILLSELLSQAVTYQNGKKTVGVVGDVLFTEDMSKIKNIIIFDMDTESQEGIADAADIAEINGEQVVLKAGARIEKTTDPLLHNSPINNNVTTTDGKIIGTVKDVELDGLKCAGLYVGGELKIEPAFIATRTPRYIVLKNQHAKGFFLKNSLAEDSEKTTPATPAENNLVKKNIEDGHNTDGGSSSNANKKNEEAEASPENLLTGKDAVTKISKMLPKTDEDSDEEKSVLKVKAVRSAKKKDVKPDEQKQPKPDSSRSVTASPDASGNSAHKVSASTSGNPSTTAVNSHSSTTAVTTNGHNQENSDSSVGGAKPDTVAKNQSVPEKHTPSGKPTARDESNSEPKANAFTKTQSDNKAANTNSQSVGITPHSDINQIAKAEQHKSAPTTNANEQTAVDLLKNSPLYKKKSEPVNKKQTSDKHHIPARIISDFAFLLGRIVTDDITDLSGNILIPKETLIVVDTVRIARNNLKLLDLTIKSRA